MAGMSERFEERLRAAITSRPPQRVTIEDARAAAVLIPVYADPEPSLIFTVRTDTLPSHKGQISFPGGSIDDSDPSPLAAALRETEEELGLDPGVVTVVGELDSTPTFVSGYVIAPFVGLLPHRPSLTPNPAEVAAVLEVPIADLVEEIRTEPGFRHEERTYPTEAWVWRDHVIWGVTARVLRMFLTRLAEVGLATAPGETNSWTAWPLPTGRS
jgi:8-oxo-dGTP pyrophosphatase MutT (NUDIX family)